MGYNKIILEGHLTRDVEIKYTQGGAAIGNTAIAISRKFKAADGTQKEDVLFVDITFFGRTAEIANQFLRKGSHVLVDGRLNLDQWTDQTTQAKRSKHSVTVENLTMLGSKDDQPQQPAHNAPQGQQPPQYGAPAAYQQPQQHAQPPAYQQPTQPAYQQPAYAPPAAQPHNAQPPAGYGQPAQQTEVILGYAPNGAPIYGHPGNPAGATP